MKQFEFRVPKRRRHRRFDPGGTDLFLGLRDTGDIGVALLDTAQTHARAAAQMLE
jgi:hypothetical protein